MADILSFDDLAAAMPQGLDPTVVQDVNALLTVQVPGLADASPDVRAAARALVRQRLRALAASEGARRVSRTRGPFSYTLDFGDGGGDLFGADLLGQLRQLVDPAAGSRLVMLDLDYVPHVPPVRAYDAADEYSTPRLRW
ncbi:hypothetical protein LG274_02670 [Micrococcus antarcticus]|uniref:hypothetical protein n=1 Tax=Micrococcus antarcticus TaxID=86171 RepID=UPI00384CA329